MKVRVNLYFCFMEINDALVDKLATLARLRFEGAEKESIKSDLNKMIRFIDKLNELDTTGVEPLIYLNEKEQALRADEIKGMCTREDGLKNAAMHNEQFFKVPKVINKDGN
jgi:aspartyl-tRNA(Asn)/glutamyl-tRNA(Gln) amidotransferase subunit C